MVPVSFFFDRVFSSSSIEIKKFILFQALLAVVDLLVRPRPFFHEPTQRWLPILFLFAYSIQSAIYLYVFHGTNLDNKNYIYNVFDIVDKPFQAVIAVSIVYLLVPCFQGCIWLIVHARNYCLNSGRIQNISKIYLF